MKKILLVDDDFDTLQLSSMLLESPTRIILTAETGKDCLKIVEAQRPSVVFCDVTLPDISGQEIVERIRVISPETSVILVSGRDGLEKITQDCGASGYIKKPYDIASLESWI